MPTFFEDAIITRREFLVPRCLTIRLPGVPLVGEFFAFGSAWIASQMVDIMETAIETRLSPIKIAKKALGIGQGEKAIDKGVPPRIFDLLGKGAPPGGFEVNIPGLFDIVKLGILAERTPEIDRLEIQVELFNRAIEVSTKPEQQRLFIEQRDALTRQLGRLVQVQEEAEREELIEQIRLSPAPESSRQRAAILTSMDNVQDDVATLAASLHLIQFLVGRAFPVVGQIALVADVMALVQGGLRVKPRNFRIAGKGKGAVKKEIQRVGEGKYGTQANRIEQANRGGKLGIGMSDLIQGLQSLEQHTGYGLRLGPIFGAITDLYYGFLRGATVVFSGPLEDPFNLSRKGCTRSPGLSDIAANAEMQCHLSALRIWDYGSRLLECPDCLTDLSRKRVLWGLAYAMECLYPWLIGQDWERDIENFMGEPVMGVFPRDSRSEDVWDVFAPKGEWISTHLTGDPDRNITPQEWVQQGSVALGDRLLENINLIKDPTERQILENVLVGSSWSLLAGLNPLGRIVESELSPSILEDLAAMDGDPGASQRLEALIEANSPIENGLKPS